jgi:hypothetical protein
MRLHDSASDLIDAFLHNFEGVNQVDFDDKIAGSGTIQKGVDTPCFRTASFARLRKINSKAADMFMDEDEANGSLRRSSGKEESKIQPEEEQIETTKRHLDFDQSKLASLSKSRQDDTSQASQSRSTHQRVVSLSQMNLKGQSSLEKTA